jgi:O-antigen/teichoic acid export membrane protein
MVTEAVLNSITQAISSKIGLIQGSKLKAKVARASIALFVGTIIGRGMTFVRYMILARILAPDEFGLMAIIIFVTMAFENFTEVGIKTSVIQNKRGADPEYLNAALWVQVIRGLGLFLIAILAASWISSFYDKPQLLRMLQVSFLSILFRGLISPRAHVLEKEYKFGRVVFLTQCSSILGTVITIGLALTVRNVWALVIGFVVEAAILSLLSYILTPIIPRLSIDQECLGELMKFARGMYGLPILTMIAFGADVLVLGKVVSEEHLGMYSLAGIFAYLPIELYSRVIAPVLLPTFAQKQDNRDSLCKIVLYFTQVTAFFVIPLVALIASCASGILLLAYGPKYVVVAIPLGILCSQVLARTEGTILGSVYFAVGQPHLHRRFVTLRAVIVVVLIYPAVIHFGLSGAAIVVVLANFAALLMQIFWCRRVINLKFTNYIRQYIPGMLLALPIIVAISLLRLFGIKSPMHIFIVGAFVSLAMFTVGICVLKHLNRLASIKIGTEPRLNPLPSVGGKDV